MSLKDFFASGKITTSLQDKEIFIGGLWYRCDDTGFYTVDVNGRKANYHPWYLSRLAGDCGAAVADSSYSLYSHIPFWQELLPKLGINVILVSYSPCQAEYAQGAIALGFKPVFTKQSPRKGKDDPYPITYYTWEADEKNIISGYVNSYGITTGFKIRKIGEDGHE